MERIELREEIGRIKEEKRRGEGEYGVEREMLVGKVRDVLGIN